MPKKATLLSFGLLVNVAFNPKFISVKIGQNIKYYTKGPLVNNKQFYNASKSFTPPPHQCYT